MEFEIENTPAFQKEWSKLVKTAKPAWQKKRKKIYTLYLRENGEIIASGTAEECAKQMGIPESAFRMILSRTNRGIIKRYEAEIRDCAEEEI
jgi:DNA-binding transcriptional regulator PaaX